MIKYFLLLALIVSTASQGFSFSTYKHGFMNSNPYCPDKDTIKDGQKIIPPAEYFLKNGKSFIILQSAESDYLVDVRVFGKGFSGFKDTIFFEEIEIIDTVLIADINNDGFEEIYIFTRGFFPGAYDHVFGVTSDEDITYKEINFYDIKQSDVVDGAVFNGYQGQDVYTLENNLIKRTFPVYNPGDFYNYPSRGYKTLFYTLEKTNTGFYFKIKN
jgi:hypothetical protein